MSQDRTPSLLPSLLFPALAGGMGWGIRGQYGHETGAMIAGVLVGLVLVLIFARSASSLAGARAAALMTLGISLGGSMTYGQTVGLTHDVELVGNWPALRWGLMGLFLKGGIWIGLAGAFLGIGLGGRRYRSVELGLILISLCFLWFLGVYLLNQPYDPGQRVLPRIYFSADWRWEPDGNLQPRREIWGGLLAALLGLVLYVRVAKRDYLAWRLAGWGFLAGGLGFALGQSVQATHAWNAEWFGTTAYLKQLEPYVNWWNMMETTFGMVFGAVLALGVWLNCDLIDPDARDPAQPPPSAELTIGGEWLLVTLHVAAVLAWSFVSFAAYDRFADQALTMILIPAVAVVAGYGWPYLLTSPIVLLPIAGKTVRELVYDAGEVSPLIGWIAYLAVPLALSLLTAVWLFRRRERQTAGRFAAVALSVNTWIYFLLNLAFFRYPWPWQPWTGRTPNGLIFTGCAVGLTVAAIAYTWTGRGDDQAAEPGA